MECIINCVTVNTLLVLLADIFLTKSRKSIKKIIEDVEHQNKTFDKILKAVEL